MKSKQVFFFDSSVSLNELKERFAHLALFAMEQVHDNKVKLLEPKDHPLAFYPGAFNTIKGVDTLVVKKKGVGLIVKHADCLPILISHPSGVIAAVHAGRKGTEKQIFLKTLSLLIEKFNITKDLKVWFGPRICRNCYQIDRETNLYYDLVEKNINQLELLFKPNQYDLMIHPSCTFCDERFHSYRREGKGVKMNYSVVTTQKGSSLSVLEKTNRMFLFIITINSSLSALI